MKPNPAAKTPEFTERQVAYLERLFPEVVGTGSTSHAEFLIQAGKRTVVAHLRSLQQKTPGV